MSTKNFVKIFSNFLLKIVRKLLNFFLANQPDEQRFAMKLIGKLDAAGVRVDSHFSHCISNRPLDSTRSLRTYIRIYRIYVSVSMSVNVGISLLFHSFNESF